MMTEKIQELITYEEWVEAFPSIQQLRTEITLERYLILFADMRKGGYTLSAFFKNEQIVAVTGISWHVNFYPALTVSNLSVPKAKRQVQDAHLKWKDENDQEMQKWREKGAMNEHHYFDLVYRLKEDITEFIDRNPNRT